MTNPQTEEPMPNLDKDELKKKIKDILERADDYMATEEITREQAIEELLSLLDHVRKEERRRVLEQLQYGGLYQLPRGMERVYGIDENGNQYKGMYVTEDALKFRSSPQPPQKEEV